MIAATPALALDNAGSLSGVVNGANGQPVTGAFVRLKNADKRLTFMVVSQAGGRYTASDLPPGAYTVQGIGGTMQSAISAPVSVSANQTAQSNVALNQNRGPLLAPSWPGRVPQAQLASIPTAATALPDGDGKALVAEKCTVCHDVQRIMAKRSNAADWGFTIKRMQGMAAGTISDAEAAQIVNYVTASFQAPGGTDPNSRLPTYLMPAGLSQKYRVVTIDLPRKYSEPHDIASDPKGIAWAAERAGALIRFDPKTYDFTEVKIPQDRAGRPPASWQSADQRQGHSVDGGRTQQSVALL
jgi:cytochrome c5